MKSQNLKKILLVLVSGGLTVLVIEVASGLMLKSGFGFFSEVRFSERPIEGRQLLPFEIPSRFSELPRYGYVPSPSDHRNDLGVDGVIEYDDTEDPDRLSYLKRNHEGHRKRTDRRTGHVIYNARVRTDAFGRRIAKPIHQERKSPRHLLMFGCSVVFGSGVNDEHTVAWKINELQTDFEAYNLAVEGFGPNGFFPRFEDENFLEGVTQKKGVAVYGLIPNGIFRAVGSTSEGEWAKALPDIVEAGPSRFVNRGAFAESRPFATNVKFWLANSNFFRLFNIHLPILTEAHYRQVARQFVGLRENYIRETSSENVFVVVLYPVGWPPEIGQKMREALSEAGVTFIDYSSEELPTHVNGPPTIDFDGHPTPASHLVIAQALLKDLPLQK